MKFLTNRGSQIMLKYMLFYFAHSKHGRASVSVAASLYQQKRGAKHTQNARLQRYRTRKICTHYKIYTPCNVGTVAYVV